MVELDDDVTLVFSNLSAPVSQQVQQAYDEHRERCHPKYDRYRIYGRWIPKLWAKTAKDFELQQRRFQRVIASLMRYIVSVTPGIITPRNQKTRRSRAGPNPSPSASATTFEKVCKVRRAASCWLNKATFS
jgi:hypothetical protein